MKLGFLSTARINAKLLAGAALAEGVEVVAVASRTPERAQQYANDTGIARAHGSYEALLADADVDAVYIALPNALHAEWATRALEAGKHVLCEKPLAADPDTVERCFDVAAERGLVLAEGFMWRHHPQARTLEALVSGGAIGELRLVRAVFSFVLDRPDDVRWDVDLDGGSLMDVGCYCVSAARLLAGEPEHASGAAVLAPSGVDARFAGTLAFGGDVLASFHCAFDLPSRSELEAVGSEGTIVVPDPWHARAPGIEIRRADGTTETVEIENADPYACELEDLAAAIRGERQALLGREDAVGQARALAALRDAAKTIHPKETHA